MLLQPTRVPGLAGRACASVTCGRQGDACGRHALKNCNIVGSFFTVALMDDGYPPPPPSSFHFMRHNPPPPLPPISCVFTWGDPHEGKLGLLSAAAAAAATSRAPVSLPGTVTSEGVVGGSGRRASMSEVEEGSRAGSCRQASFGDRDSLSPRGGALQLPQQVCARVLACVRVCVCARECVCVCLRVACYV